MATLEGGSCTVPEAVVTVLCTTDDGCGWHPKHVQWTCRIINRLLCVASRWAVINIQGDSKRWTQLNSKRRPNTRQTVGCGIPSSLLTLRVDLRELRSNVSWISLKFSSDTGGRPELLPLHRQPICSNWWLQRQMLFLVGGCLLKRRRNARCTAVTESVLMNSRKQKILCCIVVILLSKDAAAWLCARRAL